LLGAALCEHHCSRQWQYAINMDETDQDSLASYLGITHRQLCSLLLASGLASYHGKQFWLHRSGCNLSYSFQHFIAKQSHEGHVDCYSFNNKKHMWVGLGLMKKKVVLVNLRQQEQLPLTPETRSRFFKTPPRLPKYNLASLQRKRLMMLSVLDICTSKRLRNKVTDGADEDEEDNLDATITKINSEDDRDEMHKNLCTSALLLLEQILTDKSTDPVGAMEGLLRSIRVSQNAKQQARLSLVSGNNHKEEQQFETCESSFPILSQIGHPDTKRLVSSLLREIVALSCLYPDCGLLSYQTHCGTSCELVKVMRSKNKESFITNVRRHQSWLH
jgi:hypothetical protein